MFHRRRLVLATAAALLALLLMPVVAAATDGQMEIVRVGGDANNLQLVIDRAAGATGSANWKLVESGGVIHITTTNGVLPDPQSNADGQCFYPDPGDPNAVNCTDSVSGTLKSIVVYAGDADDVIDAGGILTMPVTIHGEGGNDYLVGGAVNDMLDGQAGDDALQGSCGVDAYDGGAGRDAVSYYNDASTCPQHATNGVNVSLDGVANDPDGENAGGATDAQGSIESIHGTDGKDVLTLGAASGQVYGNGGDDTINARNGMSDSVDCGDGTDSVLIDAGLLDGASANCEHAYHPGEEAPKPPINRYTGVLGCPASQQSKDVGLVTLCYAKQKQLSSTKYELSGDVNVGGFLFLSATAPVTVDTVAKSASFSGGGTITVVWGSSRIPVAQVSGNVSMNLSTRTFTMSTTSSIPLLTLAGQKLSFLTSNGLIAGAGAIAQKFSVDVQKQSITYPAGFSVLGGVLTSIGTVGYSASDGPIASVAGCVKGSVKLPPGSSIAELQHLCIGWDRQQQLWSFGGQAVILGQIRGNLAASLVKGQLNELSAGFSSSSRLAMPFGAYLNGGSIYVGGLQSTPSFSGTLLGGWPYVSGGIADITIKGTVGYSSGTRVFSINGSGSVKAGGVELGNGSLKLNFGLGTNFTAASLNAGVRVNALSGFVTGQATASIDGGGFFASGQMTLGFPAGADITNQVNSAMERVLFCNVSLPFIGAFNWCPYVTGRSVSTQAVVSSKGVGAHADFGVIKPTVYWYAPARQFGWDLGFTGSPDLNVVLAKDRVQRKRVGMRPEIVREAKPLSWTIPAGVRLASLQLYGSPDGDLKVMDPSGRVVLDTAAQVRVDGVGFGRDAGSSRGSLGLVAPAIKAGTWKIVTSGAHPYTKIQPLLALAPPIAKVVAVKLAKGTKAQALVAGSAKLKIAYRAPAGSSIELRAVNGTSSAPIASSMHGAGTRMWKVPAAWAGPLRVEAVTVRGGVPTETSLFATHYQVVRPKLGKLARVKAVRTGKGNVTVTWKRMHGAASYDVELLVGSAKHGVAVVAHGAKLVLSPRSADAMRVRVRAVSAIGVAAPWSAPVRVKALPKPKAPKKHHPHK